LSSWPVAPRDGDPGATDAAAGPPRTQGRSVRQRLWRRCAARNQHHSRARPPPEEAAGRAQSDHRNRDAPRTGIPPRRAEGGAVMFDRNSLVTQLGWRLGIVLSIGTLLQMAWLFVHFRGLEAGNAEAGLMCELLDFFKDVAWTTPVIGIAT